MLFSPVLRCETRVVYWHHNKSKGDSTNASKSHCYVKFEHHILKYWGHRDDARRIPLNNSISMNLDSATTTTTVAFDNALDDDHIMLGGAQANSAPRASQTRRISKSKRRT
jgi:mevalonate pyrophosphate decarboxylase